MGNPSGDPAADAATLQRGAVDCLPRGALERKCAEARQRGEPLRVKLGIDPTAPDIHLGHAVVLRKLRAFQDAGHTVVLIVGDFTARVGDPSGRTELRPLLELHEIEANARTFQEQALRILSAAPGALAVRRNSEWLGMGLSEALALLKTTTVAQIVEREDFAARLAAGQPISMLETLYPLLQGYDSVAVRADVELGGTDQKFNLLLGRDIQRAYGQPEQAVITMPILVGTDGRRKMSKSLGNQIGITDEPEEMFGKLMSIPDTVMGDYHRLLLGAQQPAGLQPVQAKRRLARELVSWLHCPQAAADAESHFDRVVVGGRPPARIPELALDDDELRTQRGEPGADAAAAHGDGAGGHASAVGPADGSPTGEPVADGPAASFHLPAVIAKAFGLSRSQARRLLADGAVSLDGATVAPDELDLPAGRLDGHVLQAGKRRFARLHVS